METKEPNVKRLRETIALIRLIIDSERDLREGRWITQEELEKVLREKYGI
jgi:hypothetical protein